MSDGVKNYFSGMWGTCIYNAILQICYWLLLMFKKQFNSYKTCHHFLVKSVFLVKMTVETFIEALSIFRCCNCRSVQSFWSTNGTFICSCLGSRTDSSYHTHFIHQNSCYIMKCVLVTWDSSMSCLSSQTFTHFHIVCVPIFLNKHLKGHLVDTLV